MQMRNYQKRYSTGHKTKKRNSEQGKSIYHAKLICFQIQLSGNSLCTNKWECCLESKFEVQQKRKQCLALRGHTLF